MSKVLRLTAMISGGGRTLCNLQKAIELGQINADIVMVIASREDCSGIERARAAGLEVHVPSRSHYDDELAQLVKTSAPDVICLCGYLRKLRIEPSWEGRIINIHPSLLPRHGGQGMYGDRVHQAVLEAGDSLSGCTVHFVDDQYDHGPILLQRVCRVHQDDSAETLAARVFHEECIALPRAVELLARKRVKLINDRVEIHPDITINQSGLS